MVDQRRIVWALIGVVVMYESARAEPLGRAQPPPITATFSIVAVDPEEGICGAAVASKYPAVGKVVPYVRAGVGGFCTQHHHVPAWGERALDLLEKGNRPEAVFVELFKDDRQSELRQLAIIDMADKYAHQKHEAKGAWRGGQLPFEHPCKSRPDPIATD